MHCSATMTANGCNSCWDGPGRLQHRMANVICDHWHNTSEHQSEYIYTLASNNDAGKASLTSLYIPTLLLNSPVLMLVHTIVDVPITAMVTTLGYQRTSVIFYYVYTYTIARSSSTADSFLQDAYHHKLL
eukprot:896989-Pleurochrysis_carterae.AAC.1